MKMIDLPSHGTRTFLAILVSSALALTARGQETSPAGSVTDNSGQTTFSGRAVAVDATINGVRTVISDTGPLPSSGGSLETSLLKFSVAGIGTAEVGHSTTVGQGDRSRSEASLATINLAAGGHTLTGGFLMARATAVCANGAASVSGSSELANLVIDGYPLTVSTARNQRFVLPDGSGYVTINEQIAGPGSITVNALHIVVFNSGGGGPEADIVISSAHADIACGSVTCNGGDFLTGGGWIATQSHSRATFAVAAGMKDNQLGGHLNYIDHGRHMRVKGTGVTSYTSTGATSRHIEGTCLVNGQAGFTYMVDASDNGEPGRNDTFALRLSNGYAAGGNLAGGNIQLHSPCH